ncbi:phosphatidylserine decarboxylase [Pseudomonas sp. S37]|nr:phosphatidylserine decarboxylase [Pseudomonas sp. S37]
MDQADNRYCNILSVAAAPNLRSHINADGTITECHCVAGKLVPPHP